MSKILIAPSSFGACGDEPIEILSSHGFEILNNPYGRKITTTELLELGRDMVGVIAGLETYSKEILDELINLKCISRVGIGMDNVDIDYAKTKGIHVINTPDGPTQPVAELSIGLAMNLLRRISISDRRVRSGVWKKEIGNLIQGRNVGIVGLGRIGKRTAQLYNLLGCKVTAYDIYPDLNWMKENNVENSTLERILSEADIISIHVPGLTEGIPLISSKELNLLQPQAIIINLSRGGVIDEAELYHYLKKNSDIFCALDVFNQEPYNGPLTELENLIFTPHLGSYAKDAKLKMEVEAVNNLIRVLA